MHRSDSGAGLRPLASLPAPRLGIIGGGQLARMTASAAAKFGCEVVVLERQDDFPAHSLDTHAIIGDWDNPADLMKFAELVDVVMLENEFVGLDSLTLLADNRHTLWPNVQTMALVQDKFRQKTVFSAAGLPVARFAEAATRGGLAEFGLPAVLKKRFNSYDGKGNATVADRAALDAAWAKLDGDRQALYVEERCAFERELAIVVTRGQDGGSAFYPVVETVNREHICHAVKAPADVPERVAEEVRRIAAAAVAAVDGVGSFGLEFFLMPDGHVLLNEIAPRVHNTGHYTIEACVCSQFENHVRAVLGWPLGAATMIAPAAAMVNLLGFADGDGAPLGLADALQVPGAQIHLYGKTKSVRGRKMGHVTASGRDVDEALALAQRAADCIQFGGTL